MHSKLAVSIFYLSIVLSSALIAQSDSTKVAKNSLEKGARSLQFRVTENFTLSSFDGSDISYKRHTSAKTAQRLGVSILIDLDSDNGSSNSSNVSGGRQDNEVSENQYGLTLNALWMKYLTPENRMSFYWGIGPIGGVTFWDRNSKATTIFSDTTMRTSESEQDQLSLQLGGILVFGTEFFVHKQISLTAEYRSTSAFYRSSSDRTQKETDVNGELSTQNSETSSNRFQIGGSAVYLGLSAYF
ncbi:MAG: hypothetical protein ACRBF0_19470 [Calditrichia bacterium]